MDKIFLLGHLVLQIFEKVEIFSFLAVKITQLLAHYNPKLLNER